MKYRLYTPGPTSVPEATLLELAKPVHHHRTADFRAMFNEVQQLLQYVCQTKQPVLTLTASGTAAAEAGIVNTLGPGQKALCIVNGKFAERWSQVCSTYGIAHKDLKLEYGQHATPQQVRDELKGERYDAVILVHSETSTATACDLEGIGRAVRESGDALLIVDGITSIGALPFRMDDWGVDVAITGSQKALMLPPGLSFVALSQRAWKAVEARTPSPGTPGEGRGEGQPFYLNLLKYRKSLPDGDTPFTPANTLIQALHVSLKMIREETLEQVWKRTRISAEAVRQAARVMGLELFSHQPSDSVTAIRYPKGISDKDFRGRLRTIHNIHVAGGQGSMEGHIFRINHMGYCDAYDALAVVAATEHVLSNLGHPVQVGQGVAAAQRVLAELF